MGPTRRYPSRPIDHRAVCTATRWVSEIVVGSIPHMIRMSAVAARCCQRHTVHCCCLYRTRLQSACRGEIFQVQRSGRSSRRKYPYFGDTLYFLTIQRSICNGKPVCKKSSSICAAVLTQYRRVTDRHTEGHMASGNIRAIIASCG